MDTNKPTVTTLEEERLKLEQAKVTLEIKKLELDREKAKWSAIGTIVPIVVALTTIIYGVWSLGKTAQSQFQSKVAELALAAPDAANAKDRARILAALFKELLPEAFHKRLEQMDPEKFGVFLNPNDRIIVDAKLKLFQAISANPTHRGDLINTWKVLFPDDAWAQAMPVK